MDAPSRRCARVTLRKMVLNVSALHNTLTKGDNTDPMAMEGVNPRAHPRVRE